MFHGSTSQIHSVSRAQLLDDAFNFAQTDQLSYAIFLNLTRFLANDIDYIPWAAANSGLTYLDRMFASHANHHVFRVKIYFIAIIHVWILYRMERVGPEHTISVYHLAPSPAVC